MDLKPRRQGGAPGEDTGRILRRARRLRIVSVAAAMATVGVFGLFLAPSLHQHFGIRTTLLFETLIVGACLTAFCALLFPYALGLPLQLLPTFMIR